MQHFEYVQSEDLEKVGMSKPAAKRLLDIIKRRRLKSKLTKFLPTVGKFGTLKRWGVATLISNQMIQICNWWSGRAQWRTACNIPGCRSSSAHLPHSGAELLCLCHLVGK